MSNFATKEVMNNGFTMFLTTAIVINLNNLSPEEVVLDWKGLKNRHQTNTRTFRGTLAPHSPFHHLAVSEVDDLSSPHQFLMPILYIDFTVYSPEDSKC